MKKVSKSKTKERAGAMVGVLLVFALCFGHSSVTKAITTGNLVQNPTLEVGTVTAPDYFIVGGYGVNTPVFSYDNTFPGNSTKAIKVTMTSFTDGDAKWYFDAVPVEAGGQYHFSDKYMSTTTTYLYAAFTLADTTMHYDLIATVPSSSGAWVTGSQDFTAPANAVSVSIFHALQGLGELATDDYSVTQLYSSADNLFSQGIVSITFDDGWANQYTNALPALTSNNLPASFYIITGTLSDPQYMNTTQVLSLQTLGNEVSAHTVNHCNLATLPSLAFCAFQPAGGSTTPAFEINTSRSSMLTLGANPVTTFAYPNGGYNDTVKGLVNADGFIAARTVDDGYNTRYSDKFALKTKVMDQGIPVATVKTWIDSAAANHTWLILTFHQVDNPAVLTSNGEQGGVPPQYFQDIADYIALKKNATTNPILVKTVKDVIPLMASSSPAGDTTAPVITLTGSTTMNLVTGDTFTDPGATASDNVDGNITSSIVVTGTVNTAVVGSYVLHYNVSDATHNAATEVTRTVIVALPPNHAPIITLVGDASITQTQGQAYADQGATATDAEDGAITSSIITTGLVNVDVEGDYTLTYNVSDSLGLAATPVTRTVHITHASGGAGTTGGTTTPPAQTTTPPATGGGGGGGSYTPPVVPVTVVTNNSGQVLGATCTTLLEKNLAYGKKNEKNEVKKLQSFLNGKMKTKLPVTGFYGSMTMGAVKNFQAMYKDDILVPAKLKKPNGNVHNLTRAKINKLSCETN